LYHATYNAAGYSIRPETEQHYRHKRGEPYSVFCMCHTHTYHVITQVAHFIKISNL